MHVLEKMRQHITVIFSILFCSLAAYAFVSYFTGTLRVEETFGCYFDALGSSLLQGKLDVPEKYIQGEAFINNGKYYGYFGTFPAIVRITLNEIFPGMYCKWSRIVMLSFYLLTLCICYKIYLEIKQKTKTTQFDDSIFILLLGLSSSLLYLTSKSFIYHESIIVAQFCSLVSYYSFIKYLSKRGKKYFYTSLIFAFFATHTRLNIGFGNIFTLSVYFLLSTISTLPLSEKIHKYIYLFLPKDKYHKESNTNLLAIFFLITITVVSLCGINYLKFGSYLTFAPLEKHIGFITDPARLLKLTGVNKSTVLHSSNIIHNFRYYFGFGGIELSPKFPYISPQSFRDNIPRKDSIDNIEHNVSFLYSNPILFLFVLIGIFLVLFRSRDGKLFLPMLGSIVTGIFTLSAIGVSERYFHDFLSLIVIAGTVGFIHISTSISKSSALKILFVLFFTYALYVNIAISILNQRRSGGTQILSNIEKNETSLSIASQGALPRLVFKTGYITRNIIVQHSPSCISAEIIKPLGAKYFSFDAVMSSDLVKRDIKNGVTFTAKIFLGDKLFQEKSTYSRPSSFTFGPFPEVDKSYQIVLQLSASSTAKADYEWSGWAGFHWNDNKGWLKKIINNFQDYVEK